LYRQLLRWCNDTDPAIPLSQFIPPIRLEPPQIDSGSLKSLLVSTGDNKIRQLLPSNSIIKETELTVPIYSSQTVKLFFKAIFRMNSTSTETKEQISLAFEALKNLNELSSKQLSVLIENRVKHYDRTGVEYKVGQVVQHKKDRWRGVILGWNCLVSNNDNTESKQQEQQTKSATSLTKKSYQPSDPSDTIRYIVVLDWGDATILHQASKPISSIMNVYQSDIHLVADPQLLRIRSGQMNEHFKRFDQTSGSFVPGDVSSYVYPNDVDDREQEECYVNASDDVAKEYITGIQNMADHLRMIVLSYTSSPESRNLKVLSSYLDKLTRLSNGDVLSVEDQFKHSTNTQVIMKCHIEEFMKFIVELNDIMWTRRTSIQASKQNNRTIKYKLGDIVEHKKYGFRGVIVAWDPGTFTLCVHFCFAFCVRTTLILSLTATRSALISSHRTCI
jgi:heat shock protein HspQ